MKYEQAKTLIGEGDVLAFTHEGWGSLYDLQVQAVMIAEKSPFSHVAVALPTRDMGLWIVESVEPLVRAIPLVNQDNARHGFWWCRMDRPMSDLEKAFYLKHIGVTGYSKLGGIRAMLGDEDVMNEMDWMECAKLIAVGRKLTNIDLGNRAVPEDVFKAAQALPDAETIFVEL